MHQTGHALALGSQESFALESAGAKVPALSISLLFTAAVDTNSAVDTEDLRQSWEHISTSTLHVLTACLATRPKQE